MARRLLKRSRNYSRVRRSFSLRADSVQRAMTLHAMLRDLVMTILRSIVKGPPQFERRFYKIACMGESLIEEAIGKKILAIPGVELGYCARPGEVDVRIIGKHAALDQADQIVRAQL